mgnify:FL=1
MQFDKSFTSHFVDPSTGLPITWLTGVTITILQRNDDNTYTKVVDTQACTEIMEWWYHYVFSAIQDKFYLYAIYPNDSRVQPESGFVDKRLNNLDQAVSDIRGGWGGFSINYGTINSHTTNKVKELYDEFKKHKAELEKWFNDTNSHIDIAKWEITDKIDSIEIPKTDLSDLNKSIGIARQQLTKLSEFIRKEAENEKKEIEKEYEGKISELETTINGIEAMFEEFKGMSEEEKKTLLESKENELKEITEFADEAIEYYKEMKDKAGEDTINKLKSLL